MEWQPIETASDLPDDVEVLVVVDGDVVYLAQKRQGEWWAADCCPDEWTELLVPPSHWMELPDPPAKAA